MGARYDQYRVKVGDDLGNPEYWNNPRFKDLDNRLNTLEAQKTSLDDVINEGRIIFRERVDDVLIPLVQEVDAIAEVGVMLRAASHTQIEISNGGKTLWIDEDQKGRFAAPAFVSIVSNNDGTGGYVLLASVVSYDRDSGALVVDVRDHVGVGFWSDWTIVIGAPTDSADDARAAIQAAADAAASRDVASGFAQTSSDKADLANSAALQAVAANSQAQGAASTTTSARDDTLAGINQWKSAVLAPSEIAPSSRPGGQALQVGDQYFKPSQGYWYTWDGTQWTVNAVPSGSEVSSVFGRTGPVAAQSGDYRADQVARSSAQQAIVAGATAEAAIQTVNTALGNKLDSSSASTFVKSNILGAADAATVRTKIGLSALATQDPNAVSITGGNVGASVIHDDGSW